ncbi:MAG: sigma-54 interaction domain-containing protein [Desulfitobacteriaceae bacterium]
MVTKHRQMTHDQSPHFMDLMNEMQAVLDAIYSAVVAIDVNGNISFINKAAECFLGPAEGVLGQAITAVIPESEMLGIVQGEQFQSGRRLCIADKTVIINRNPIIIDGRISGMVVTFLDITDLETVVDELRAVRELNSELNALIDSSADGLVICDGEGTLLRMNRAYKRIIGIPDLEQFIGKQVMELVNQGYISAAVTTKVLETKEATTRVQEIRGKEILFTSTPVFDDSNRLVRVIGNIRDLSELNSMRRKVQQITEEVAHYRSEISRLRLKSLKEGFVFSSLEMKRALELTLRVARVDTTVLFEGESGVGKEVFIRIIHEASKRSNMPFIKVNCGAFAPTLIESELFGYVEGAFTGANRRGKPGIFELASGGTLFLDEVGELPLDIQVKLLRVIQEQEVTRIGGTVNIPIDVRLVGATNRDLQELVQAGKFRKDLFFRLKVVVIKIPPLREHVTDIPPLAEHFVRLFCRKHNLVRRISGPLMKKLVIYDWPGNIRELENTIERMVIVSTGEEMDSSLFSEASHLTSDDLCQGTLKATLTETEKRVIIQAYKLCGSSRKAAALLGINQSTVVRKLQQYRREGELML